MYEFRRNCIFFVRRKLCIWVRVVWGIFVSGKWVIVLGTRIFCSACSSFCMQTRCEPQFSFIFLGGKSNYIYFFWVNMNFGRKMIV